jgi:8-oxo-dGTP pyrophosphatase MutT (NUDIX family)
MRCRRSSRLLVLDRASRLLLFRFVHKSGPLTGQDYWATPGGGLEPNETFEAAAIRELREETGIHLAQVGASIAQRNFVLQLPDGEHVLADERFFVVDAEEQTVHREQWTALELEVMTEHKWWSVEALETTSETVWPSDLPALLRRTGRW